MRIKGSILFSLFLLMGIALGVHSLSHHHYEHLLSHITHPEGADDENGDCVLSGDICVLSVFAQTSFETAITYDIPEALFVYFESTSFLPETPITRQARGSFSLRAPPSLHVA